MNIVDYQGLQCVELSNGLLKLLVTRSVGPRVISLQFAGGENLFAELPGETLDCPGTGKFHFYGGHRLWHAPEEPSRTYLPDDDPLEIQPMDRGVRVIQAVESKTGIQKELKIRLADGRAQVDVEHVLTNHGVWPVACAPWAITQLKPGGVAILPQFTGLTKENATLPNRTLALWPYTDINDPHIHWGNELVLINTPMSEGKLKIGFPNPRGWLAYWRDALLFVKRADYNRQGEYFDFGSSSECYCDDRFLELETLGPVTTLPPGDSVCHKEIWEIYPNVGWPETMVDMINIIETV